ncbi:MAG: hypothetical protein IH610_02570 [Deltaproteobacteria bacterium]|nr:hypothetical protein [Deltaproteobacteria bacterium]
MKITNPYGTGFSDLDVVQINIGLAQENPFHVRVLVEPESLPFRDLAEREEQADAD